MASFSAENPFGRKFVLSRTEKNKVGLFENKFWTKIIVAEKQRFSRFSTKPIFDKTNFQRKKMVSFRLLKIQISILELWSRVGLARTARHWTSLSRTAARLPALTLETEWFGPSIPALITNPLHILPSSHPDGHRQSWSRGGNGKSSL